MVGTTLADIREHIESLASDTGRYYVVCGRTGERPVPVDGLYFESRATARAAAVATEQYRDALRRYDPRLPHCDVIVSEWTGEIHSPEDARRLSVGGSQSTAGGEASDRVLVDFCHTVAGATFEAIATSDHDSLETAIMDRYLALAEEIDDTDELCLCLLESIAHEMDAHLTAAEQTALLQQAVGRLPALDADRPVPGRPLCSTLAQLQSLSVLDTYAVSDTSPESESWDVTVDGYAFSPDEGTLVTLPVVVELFRRLSGSVSIPQAGIPDTGEATSRCRFQVVRTKQPESGVTVVDVS